MITSLRVTRPPMRDVLTLNKQSRDGSDAWCTHLSINYGLTSMRRGRTLCISSGLGTRGASDGEVPIATRDIQRRKNQEEGCPSVDAVCEAHDACGGRGAATDDTRDPKEAELAVLPWVDQAVHARSRGR